MFRFLQFLSVILALVAQQASAQGRDSLVAAIPSTRQYDFHSRVTGRDYVISVALPDGYGAGGRTYPTLYVLDGKNGFALHTSFYRITHDDSLAPLIVVGIAWKQADNFAPTTDRRLDFTPTKSRGSDSSYSGGAPLFARFLREEVFPFVDRHFRTKDDRGIIGYSLGGLFAAYALLEEPDLFRRYGIGSPSLWWDNNVILRRESELAARGVRLRGTVYMTVGGGEAPMMKAPMRAFADSLLARHYDGLHLTTAVLDSAGHNPIIPGYLALRALYILPRAQKALLQSARAGGADSVVARYHELKSREPDAWVFDAFQLNGVGYWFLQHGRKADAVRVFQLNVAEYPRDSNPYDSLGEAYVAVGDTTAAIAAYDCAVRLDSTNTNSAKMLNDLRRRSNASSATCRLPRR